MMIKEIAMMSMLMIILANDDSTMLSPSFYEPSKYSFIMARSIRFTYYLFLSKSLNSSDSELNLKHAYTKDL